MSCNIVVLLGHLEDSSCSLVRVTRLQGCSRAAKIIVIGLSGCLTTGSLSILSCDDGLVEQELSSSRTFTAGLTTFFGKALSPATSFLTHFEAVLCCCK